MTDHHLAGASLGGGGSWAGPLALVYGDREAWYNEQTFAGLNGVEWGGLMLNLVVAYLLGWVLQLLLVGVARWVAGRTRFGWDNALVETLPGPLRWFMTVFLLSQFLHWLHLDPGPEGYLRTILSCVLVVVLTWYLMRLLSFASDFAEAHFTEGIKDTPQARAVHTQVAVVHTVLRFLLLVLGVALVLLQFEVARTLGFSLLTSAGIATAAIAFASQRTIATIFAGLQIAFTQTIKIGDVVVVEGQWGRIEDVKLTYVVVKVWDLRRLILPVTYFTEKPFENWTTNSTEVMGTVFIYTDYSVPVDEVRQELQRTLSNTDLWDGKVSGVVVTDLTATNAEVRILVSAADSGRLWDLRCLVREQLLEWLRTRGEKYIPRQRVEAKAVTTLGDKDDKKPGVVLPPG